MEDKTYNVDKSYPRVAALLRREYAGMDCMGQLLERCTSVTPTGVVYQFEQVLKDLERNGGALEEMPLQCPYQRRRGCLNGDIWIIRHIEHEDHYNTQMTRIKNHRCAAWSDALGRCLRIHPVAFAERHAMRKHNCDDSKIPPQMV